MEPKRWVIDIAKHPELSRLVDEVWAKGLPCYLQRDGENLAVVISLAKYPITPPPPNPALDAVLAGLPKDSPVVKTAGMLHTDQPFPGYEVESELTELAMGFDLFAAEES